MKRDNLTNEGYVKQFKNDNINIKFSAEAVDNIKAGKWSEVEVLSWLLENIDTYFIGEGFCLSNYDTGAMLYDCYSDKVFIVSFGEVDRTLLEGRSMKLYAAPVDDDTREQLREEGY